MMIPRFRSLLLGALLLWGTVSAASADTAGRRYYIAGPVEAELVSVVDGDTLMVNAKP